MEGLQRDLERKKIEMTLLDQKLAIWTEKRNERLVEIQRRRGIDADVDKAGRKPAPH
jgi:hypothetical protein